MVSIASGFLSKIIETDVRMPPKKGAGTVNCPFCGSIKIGPAYSSRSFRKENQFDIQGDQKELLSQEMHCNECEKEWKNTYKYASSEEL